MEAIRNYITESKEDKLISKVYLLNQYHEIRNKSDNFTGLKSTKIDIKSISQTEIIDQIKLKIDQIIKKNIFDDTINLNKDIVIDNLEEINQLIINKIQEIKKNEEIKDPKYKNCLDHYLRNYISSTLMWYQKKKIKKTLWQDIDYLELKNLIQNKKDLYINILTLSYLIKSDKKVLDYMLESFNEEKGNKNVLEKILQNNI